MNNKNVYNLDNLLSLEVKKSLSVHSLIKEKYLPVRESLVALASLELNYLFGGSKGQIDIFINGSNSNLERNDVGYLKKQADALCEFIKHSKAYLAAFVETKKEEEFEEYFAEEHLSKILDKAMKEFFTIVFHLQAIEADYELPVI